jgi:hypothetical protein
MSDHTTLDSDMHEAFDPILDETLTDPVTGLDVVIDGFDGAATIVLLVPTEFDHPDAEEIERVDAETKRVRGGEDLWGPLVPAAHAVLAGEDPVGLDDDFDTDADIDVAVANTAEEVDDDLEDEDDLEEGHGPRS